jgi:uncharacterized protein
MKYFFSYAFKFFTFIMPFVNYSYGASFDCAKAGTKVEKLICSTPSLSKLDSSLADVYKDALRKEPAIKPDQLAWIKERNKCSSEACLEESYKERIDSLTNFIVGRDREGMRAEQKPSNTNQVKTEFKPTDKDKKLIDYTLLANMCAGFYSKWSLNATSKNCELSGDDNDLKCKAWASKDRLQGWYEYLAKKNNPNDMEVISYLKNTGATTQSYRYGVDNSANIQVSQQCFNYLYKK